MNQSEFTLKGILTLKDLTNFNYETISRTYLLFNLILLILLITQIQHEGAVLMIFTLLGLTSVFILSIKLNAKKSYNANKSFQSELKYEFSSAGINITSDSGTQFLTWDKIHKITISNNCFSIFLAKKQAFLLPKNWFRDEIEVENFNDLLHAYLDKSKIKRIRFFII